MKNPESSTGWRREMTPVERLKADADTYAELVIYMLGTEYAAMEDVRNARSTNLSRVTRVLRRSSADCLTPMVIGRLVERGLVRVEANVLYFLPALIAAWEKHGPSGLPGSVQTGAVAEGEDLA